MQNDNEKLIEKFKEIDSQFNELENLTSAVEVMSDNKLYSFYMRKYKKIENIARKIREYNSLNDDLVAMKDLITENDGSQLTSQLEELQIMIDNKFDEIRDLYFQMQAKDSQEMQIEVNCKNEEFLSYLKNLFLNYINQNNLQYNKKIEKEDSFCLIVKGEGIASIFGAFNGKIKRVFRGQETVASVVAIQVQNNKIEIKEDDLIIQTSKSSGAGGQHINKTESAVKIIHVPTGVFAECQDERSQTKNKEKAMQRLQEKLTQLNNKQSKDFEQSQRDDMKNRLFSETAAIIFDFDRNTICVTQNKKEYKIKEIEDNNLNLIGEDINL